MSRTEIPDTSKWTENILGRIDLEISGFSIGLGKKFFTYDLKHVDERFRKLMRNCIVFYAFGIERAAKSWTVYSDDGSGTIKSTVYSAILIDGPKDKWIVGLPDEIWDVKTDIREGQLVGIRIILKTEDGIRIHEIVNPENRK